MMMVMIVICHTVSHGGDDSGMPHTRDIAGHDDGNATLPAIIMVMITVSQSQTHTVPTLWP